MAVDHGGRTERDFYGEGQKSFISRNNDITNSMVFSNHGFANNHKASFEFDDGRKSSREIAMYTDAHTPGFRG